MGSSLVRCRQEIKSRFNAFAHFIWTSKFLNFELNYTEFSILKVYRIPVRIIQNKDINLKRF